MENLTGPIPVRPTDSEGIGPSYTAYQQMITGRANQLLATDKAVQASFTDVKTSFDKMFTGLRSLLKTHTDKKGLVHGETRVNTRMNYVNDYPVASTAEIINGTTYKAYIVPSNLKAALPFIRQPMRQHLLRVGGYNDSYYVKHELMDLYSSIESSKVRPAIRKSNVTSYGGRLLISCPVNHQRSGESSDTDTFLTSPERVTTLSKLIPLDTTTAGLYGVGWSQQSLVCTYEGKQTLYLTNPQRMGTSPVLNLEDFYSHAEALKITQALVLPSDDEVILGGVLWTTTGIDIDIAATQITYLGERLSLGTLAYPYNIRLVASSDWSLTKEQIRTLSLPWKDILNTSLPITFPDYANITNLANLGTFEWIEWGSRFVIFIDTELNVGTTTLNCRFYLEGLVDKVKRVITLRIAGKFKKPTWEGNVLKTDGSMLSQPLPPEHPFHPILGRGVFNPSGGHTTAFIKDLNLLKRFHKHDCGSFAEFVNGLPKLPETKFTQHATMQLRSYGALGNDPTRIWKTGSQELVVLNRTSLNTLYGSKLTWSSNQLREYLGEYQITPPSKTQYLGGQLYYPSHVVNVLGNVPSLLGTVWCSANGFIGNGVLTLSDNGNVGSDTIRLDDEVYNQLRDWVNKQSTTIKGYWGKPVPESVLDWVLYSASDLTMSSGYLLISDNLGALGFAECRLTFTNGVVAAVTLPTSVHKVFVAKTPLEAVDVDKTLISNNFTDIYIKGSGVNVEFAIRNPLQYTDNFVRFKWVNGKVELITYSEPHRYEYGFNEPCNLVFPLLDDTIFHSESPVSWTDLKRKLLVYPGSSDYVNGSVIEHTVSSGLGVVINGKFFNVPPGFTFKYNPTKTQYLYFSVLRDNITPLVSDAEITHPNKLLYLVKKP